MVHLCLISSVGVILILLFPLSMISNLANFMWRIGFLGNISEVCIIALNLVANTIGTNLKQGILVYRYTFQNFYNKIHQIILKTWIYHSTGDCDTNHCSCRGHGVGCTDYCNCDLGICQNTDGSPSALINEDLDNEYIRKFLV